MRNPMAMGGLLILALGVAACSTSRNPMVVMVERSPVAYTVPGVATPVMPVGTMVPTAPTAARAGSMVGAVAAPAPVSAIAPAPAPVPSSTGVRPPVAPAAPASPVGAGAGAPVPLTPRGVAAPPARNAPVQNAPIQASPVVALPEPAPAPPAAVIPAGAVPYPIPMVIPIYTAPSYAPPLKGKTALPVLQ